LWCDSVAVRLFDAGLFEIFNENSIVTIRSDFATGLDALPYSVSIYAHDLFFFAKLSRFMRYILETVKLINI
jgi:hypothetical protein